MIAAISFGIIGTACGLYLALASGLKFVRWYGWFITVFNLGLVLFNLSRLV